jgi:UPF0755 protein
MSQRKNKSCLLPLFLIILFLALAVMIMWIGLPVVARAQFGAPISSLTGMDLRNYSVQVLAGRKALMTSVDPAAEEKQIQINSGESITSIASRLEKKGLINDAGAFRAYLVFKGLDSNIKAGTFQLSPALTSLEIIELIQSSSSPFIDFYIFPGWRAEEIAAALPTSGLEVEPEEFLRLVYDPGWLAGMSDFYEFPTLDGFLFPGLYEIDRKVSAHELVLIFIDRFNETVTLEMVNAIESHGLSLYEGVTLASIIQRETFEDEERGLMASVFYNRMQAGMKLETDPTVQYALGYSTDWGGWWKTPLSVNDLGVISPYNTYNVFGLPPTPISNPALPSILAVAYPEESPYYYFRAKCDGSGLHDYSITLDEHLEKECK